MNQVYSNEAVIAILRGHVRISQVLDRLLKSETFAIELSSKQFSVDSLGFARSVNICAAFGLIHPEDRLFLLAFNGLRNRVAHHVPSVTETELVQFFGGFTPRYKHLSDHNLASGASRLENLAFVIETVCTRLESLRSIDALEPEFVGPSRPGLMRVAVPVGLALAALALGLICRGNPPPAKR